MINPNCHFGDHDWRGSGVCVHCGKRLRCYCGQFVTEDGIDKHIRDSCPIAFAEMADERRKIESTFAP
jgi:hypothetical protein